MSERMKEIIRLLRCGCNDDIWYDAEQYGDNERAAFILEVQRAMGEASDLLERAMKSENGGV